MNVMYYICWNKNQPIFSCIQTVFNQYSNTVQLYYDQNGSGFMHVHHVNVLVKDNVYVIMYVM